MNLNTTANIARPDDFYQIQIDTGRDLSREQSEKVNARLILLLANHIGDQDVLAEALEAASKGVTAA